MKKNLFKIGTIVSTILPISAIITCSNDKNTKKPSEETNKNKGDKSSSGSDVSKTEVKKKGKDNGQNPSVQSTKPSEEAKKNEDDKSSSGNDASESKVGKKGKDNSQKKSYQSTKPSEENNKPSSNPKEIKKDPKSSRSSTKHSKEVKKNEVDKSSNTNKKNKLQTNQTNDKNLQNIKSSTKNDNIEKNQKISLEKWIRGLKKTDFSPLIDSNKSPSSIKSKDVLKVIKRLNGFEKISKEEKNKLKLENIKLYNIDDANGKLSIQIKFIRDFTHKVKSLEGFKKKEIKVSQKDIDATNQYVAKLEKIITISKRLKNEGKKQIFIYKHEKDGSEIELPIIEEDKAKLDSTLNEYLLAYGFNKLKIFNVKTSDEDKPIKDFQPQEDDSFRIGYHKEQDNKFYLFNDNQLGYATKQEAIDHFKSIEGNLKTYKLLDFLKEHLSAIKYKLQLLGKDIDTQDLDNMIKEEAKETSVDTTTSNPSGEKSQFNLLVDKYITKKSESLKLFEKQENKKFKNENGESINYGSQTYKTSFKINKDYFIIWGLFDRSRTQKDPIKFNKFKGFDSKLFGDVDSIAVIDTKIHAGGKEIAFVFFKKDGKWIFATDYINKIEGSKIKFQITSKYDKQLKLKGSKLTNEYIKKQTHNKFDDLLDYTKSSLAE